LITDTLGGHAHTVAVPDPTSFTGSTPVDIGFMVMNNNNYPNLVRLFEDLKVPTIDSDMSLSISNSRTANDIDDRHFEFSSDNPLCQISNLFRPDFYSLVLSILRFNRELPNVLSYPPDSPIRQMSIREVRLNEERSDSSISSPPHHCTTTNNLLLVASLNAP
jgi:predicted NAD/FAD-binding protein